MPTNQENFLKKLAEVIGSVLTLPQGYGKPMGFMLIVFEFGKPGPGDYISNCQRKDCIKTLREAAEMLEIDEVIPETKGNA